MQEVTAAPTAFLVSWQSSRLPGSTGTWCSTWCGFFKGKMAASFFHLRPVYTSPPITHLKNDKDDEVVREMVITMWMIEK